MSSKPKFCNSADSVTTWTEVLLIQFLYDQETKTVEDIANEALWVDQGLAYKLKLAQKSGHCVVRSEANSVN